MKKEESVLPGNPCIKIGRGQQMEVKKVQNDTSQGNQRDYTAIVHSSAFQQLIREKKRFIVPFTLFFFIFYFALPILTSFSTILNHSFYKSITWAWVFAFAQFIMTWALCIIYSKRAARFDSLTDQVLKEGGKSE